MRTLASIALLSLVAITTPVVVTNWAKVDAYFTHNIGAPDPAQRTELSIPVEPPTARLAAAGDVGTGKDAVYRTSSVMDSLDEQQPYDALLLLGDNVYENGDPSEVHARVLEPFGPVLDRNTRLLAVLGNHDIRDDNGAAQAAALGMPNEWYVTVIENTTIVALNSNRADNPEQREWLQSTLATVTTDWLIVIMHHPAYSAGWHGGDGAVTDNFVPLFEEFGVDLVLSGHDHDYQRSKPINGVTYVVTGAAAKLRPTSSENFTAVSWSTHSFVDILIYPDSMRVNAVDHDGKAIDSFDLATA